MLVGPSPAPDTNYVGTHQHHGRDALFVCSVRDLGIHRLRRHHADPCDRYYDIVFLSTPATTQRAMMSFTRRLADTHPRALVVSKVDNCCSVLVGVSGHLLDRLPSILSAFVRLVLSARRCEHITPFLCDLCWLRVPERIRSAFVSCRTAVSMAQLRLTLLTASVV